MQSFINAVTEFHNKIQATVSNTPRLLPCDCEAESAIAEVLRKALADISRATRPENELRLRVCLALEELCEWVEAHAEADLVAAADAWGDRFYVLLGDAVSTGLPVEEIFSEVHRSNMTKDAPTGENGKGSKDHGFERPKLERCLNVSKDANL